MLINFSKIPDDLKLEITKGNLMTLAKLLMKEASHELKLQPTQIEKRDLLNLEEACELLGMAKQTVYTKTSKKLIPHCKKGGLLFFNKTELMDWIESGRQAVKSDKK